MDYRRSQELKSGSETKKEKEFFEQKILEVSQHIYEKYYKFHNSETLFPYWGMDFPSSYLTDCKNVDVKIRLKEGKGLYSTQAIRAGDVVFSEVPLVSHTLFRDTTAFSVEHCSHCLRSFSNHPRIAQVPKLFAALV